GAGGQFAKHKRASRFTDNSAESKGGVGSPADTAVTGHGDRSREGTIAAVIANSAEAQTTHARDSHWLGRAVINPAPESQARRLVDHNAAGSGSKGVVGRGNDSPCEVGDRPAEVIVLISQHDRSGAARIVLLPMRSARHFAIED